MLTVGDHQYPLCLLDTMAVSEMVKDPEGFFRHFYDWALAPEPQFIPCFTIYTIWELRQAPAVFQKFVELFQVFPCVLMKGYEELLLEEVAGYPGVADIDPCSIAFTFLGDEGNQLVNVAQLLEREPFVTREAEWNDARPEIVSGMVSLVANFPPSGQSYTSEEVRHFVWMASFEQLFHHAQSFVTTTVQGGTEINLDAFPTLKAMTYTVFHKFYTDRNRIPKESDAFDVVIAAALPYVEAVITEAHQAEALTKIKRHDEFLNRLEVFTVRDFRDQPRRRS
jgi:hypothetical protein